MSSEDSRLQVIGSLGVEIVMARDDRQRRHFVRMLEMACQELRVREWGESADVSEAVSVAAGETQP